MLRIGRRTQRAVVALVASVGVPLLFAACDDDDDPTGNGSSSVLAFSSDRDGNFEIYSSNDDGSDARRLTTSNGDDSDP